MFEAILSYFPHDTHPLTLVSDPDGLLADEALLAALTKRGFTLLDEPDPVRLRYHCIHSQPPLILVTAGPLTQLPYDLWQQSHHITLALHTFFPNLAYPQVQTLTPSQRARLASAPPPTQRLGVKRTNVYLLRHVFGLDFDALGNIVVFLAWLSQMSRQQDPFPAPLRQMLLKQLRTIPVYTDWPLNELLQKPRAFPEFLRAQWSAFLDQQTGRAVGEPLAPYLVDFENLDKLHDFLPRWVRTGMLAPVEIQTPKELPDWAQVGLLSLDVDPRPQRFEDLLTTLEDNLPADSTAARWTDWQILAWDWADLSVLRYASGLELSDEFVQAYQNIQKHFDDSFHNWLLGHYAPLASSRLPQPHHLHHIPHYLAYKRRQDQADKIALLIMDGMSLADWTLIQPAWISRHTDWLIQTQLLMAQIPSQTAISRQALISGQRPVDFSSTITHNREELKQWANFWASEDLSPNACQYERLKLRQYPPTITLISPRTRVVCLIDNTIDNITHGTLLGESDVQISINLWLEQHAAPLESLIDDLLRNGFSLFLTSDHGHTEAFGIGQPSEGIIVQTRSKRARTYHDERLMNHVRSVFPETYIWHGDGLLPDDLWVLIPQGHRAFAPVEEIHVTHGGMSIDEIIVPFVEISLADR